MEGGGEGDGVGGVGWKGEVVGFPAALGFFSWGGGREGALRSHTLTLLAVWKKSAKASCKMISFLPKTAQIRSAHTSQQAACPKPAGEVAEGGVSLRMRIETLCPVQSALALSLSLHQHMSHHPQIGKNRKRQQNCRNQAEPPQQTNARKTRKALGKRSRDMMLSAGLCQNTAITILCKGLI